MYVFLKAIFDERPESDPEGKLSLFAGNKFYLLFALLLGLSFTNHLTTILLAPACLTLFFVTLSRDKKRTYWLIRWMILFFLVGFSVYLYLPIRANMDPIFIWGNPYNLERFYWHVTGKQFSVWIFSAKGSIPVFLFLVAVLITLSAVGIAKQRSLSKHYHIITFAVLCILSFILLSTSSEIVIKQFNFFTSSLWKEFGTGIVLLALPGVYLLSRSNLKLYYFTILTFFGCVFYSVNYDIHDIASYFLLADITIAIWIGFGALWIYFKLGEYLDNELRRIVFSIVLILVSLVTLNTNYTENDESKNTYVEEFTMNIFRNIEPGGIVISSQWDFWVSASWYYQFVKNVRPDIIVIDKELLRRSWYYKHIERTRPDIYNNSKTEIDRFLVELDKFEHGIPYDQKTIMKAYSDMLTSFVTKNFGRKIYTTWEIEQNKNEPFAEDYSRIPDGLLFQLVHKDSLQNNAVKDYRIYNFEFTPTRVKDYYHETLMRSYSAMLTSSAQYLISINRHQDAKKYLDAALTAIPGFTQALDLKRKFNL